MTTCPFCSEEIAEAATKCHHCGEGLTPKPARGGDDLSEVLGWVFKDPDWVVKIIIGTACMLAFCLFVPLFALQGYKFRIARQQQRAPGATPMPAWDEPGALIWDGLKEFVSLLLAVFVMLFGLGLVFGLGVALDLLTSGKPGPFTALFGIVAYIGIFVFSLGFSFVVPAIELEFLETGSPFSSLHLGSLWRRITVRPGDYFLLFIYHFVAQMIGGFLAILLYAPVTWSLYTQGAILGRYLAQQRAKDAALGLDA